MKLSNEEILVADFQKEMLKILDSKGEINK